LVISTEAGDSISTFWGTEIIPNQIVHFLIAEKWVFADRLLSGIDIASQFHRFADNGGRNTFANRGGNGKNILE